MVTGVKIIVSMLLLANKLPIVFKIKSALIKQRTNLNTIGFTFTLIVVLIINNIKRKKTFKMIDIDSNLRSSC
jgi:hypothetical protein